MIRSRSFDARINNVAITMMTIPGEWRINSATDLCAIIKLIMKFSTRAY